MMSQGAAFYQQQAREAASSLPWLSQIKKQAYADFAGQGFPTRHFEDWKYTSVDAFLKHHFSVNHSPIGANSLQTLEAPVSSYHQAIVNGAALSAPCSLPDGVIVMPLIEALAVMPEKITPYLDQILKSEHAFHALNTAMLQRGLLIYVPANTHINKPLWISHWQDNDLQAVYLRHLVVLEQGSSLSMMEDYNGKTGSSYFTNAITEIHLARDARLTHYKVQRESKDAYHFGHVAVNQAQSSQYDSHSISLGGKWVRSDITIQLQEKHSRCLMNGLYVPGDAQHVDHHTLVHHAVPDCQSVQDYKGIMNGHSRAVFNGRVIVAKDAQHTQAKQQNKNLLLSANAEIDTKPQLEIFADDVVCTHGATVGQLDDEALFYLATRGIGREEASRYLMRAFLIENYRLIDDENIANWISELLNNQLG